MSDSTDLSKDNQRISPRPLDVGMGATELIESTFHGNGAGLIADCAAFFTNLILSRPKTCVGFSLDAVLIPGGLGVTTLLPLIQGGYVDWISITGTNLYYDALFALGKPLLRAHNADDDKIENCGGNIYIRSSDRHDADNTLREILSGPDFQQPMSSAQMHYLLGQALRAVEKDRGVTYPSLLSTAYELGVPLFNPAPTEGPLGSLIASLAFMGNRLSIDAGFDLNEAASIQANMRHHQIHNVLWCCGRGAAAGFAKGLPSHLNRIMGLSENQTSDYLMTFELLSGADETTHLPGIKTVERPTDPDEIDQEIPLSPLTLSFHTDLSTALPLVTIYILDRLPSRPQRALAASRSDLIDKLRRDHLDATLKDLQKD